MKRTTKQILTAAATLPAGMARRVAGAIMAAEAGEKRGEARQVFKHFVRAVRPGESWPSDTDDELLEAAAAAMRRAMERAALAQLETLLND